MKNNRVLIIGSGPSGINAAWPLVLAGLRVTMIDGNHVTLPELKKNETIAKLRLDPEGWRQFLGDELQGIYSDKNISLKFSTPLGDAVINTTNGMHKINLNNIAVVRGGVTGGLSNIWGAHCSIYDAQDLVNFPISYEDLKGGYRAVGNRIGISGVADDLSEFHGMEYDLQKPIPLNKSVKSVFSRYIKSSRSSDFSLGFARNAVITSRQTSRQECNQCGLCLYGCSRKSIYNSSYDLDTLKNHPNFEYYAGVTVNRFLDLGGKEKLVGTIGGGTISAKHLIIAAGTINSTALILDYLEAYDIQIPLISNPVAAMAYMVPKYIGASYETNSFSLGQLSYKLNLQSANEYATGVIYGADALPINSLARHMGFTRPTALRLANALAPSLLLATVYLPGNYSSNFIRLIKNKGSNSLERPEIMVEGQVSGKAYSELEYAFKKLSKKLMNLGSYYVPSSFNVAKPGVDAHLTGTIPMGKNGDFGCSDTCELNFAKDVYIVDGSCLPSLPSKHCTFTIMANAYRVGENLAKKLTTKIL